VTWSMSSETARPTRHPRPVHGDVLMEGYRWPEPTRRSYWHHGDHWRVEGESGPLWIHGPAGTYWDFGDPAGPLWAAPGQPFLFHHPAQEIVALKSLEELGSWLDVDEWRTEDSAFRGRKGERSADGWIDEATGTVLAVAVHDGHGAMSIVTRDFQVGNFPEFVFRYEDQARPYGQ